MSEFYTLTQSGEEITLNVGDLIVSSAGVVINARIIRFEPVIHYGDRLDIEPEILDPIDVVISRKKRDSETETQSEIGGFDLSEHLPTSEEFSPEEIVIGQQGNINTNVVRPTTGGNSPNSDGYILMENSRDGQFLFFKTYYQSLQQGAA